MTKVTLPRDVAKAIESLREISCNNQVIVEAAIGYMSGSNASTIHTYARKSEGSLNDILSALVNGYEIEQTPEERLREYYAGLRNDRIGGSKYCEANGIFQTLSILGITIAGINAPAEDSAE